MATSTANDKEYKSLVGCVTDPKTDAEVREKIISARIALLLKAPFFGNLATRLEVINADKWCGTAATDGRKLYYNSEFLKTMPAKQLEFLIGHEVLHCVYDHCSHCSQDGGVHSHGSGWSCRHESDRHQHHGRTDSVDSE